MQDIPAKNASSELDRAISSLDDWEIFVLALLKWEQGNWIEVWSLGHSSPSFFSLDEPSKLNRLATVWEIHFEQPIMEAVRRFPSLLSRLSDLLAMSLKTENLQYDCLDVTSF